QANDDIDMVQDIDMGSQMETSMDTEDTTTSQPIIQVDRMLQMKKKNAINRPQHILSQTEEEINPQLNQQLKKQLKAQQKKVRRQADGQGHNNLFNEDDDMMFQTELTAPSSTGFNPNLISAPMIDEDEEL
ncbi:hypothetical protein CU098_007863, partial [Rhizopus stolonifer]